MTALAGIAVSAFAAAVAPAWATGQPAQPERRPARLTLPTCRGLETFDIDDDRELQGRRVRAAARGERAELIRARRLPHAKRAAQQAPEDDRDTTLTSTVIVRCHDKRVLDALLAPHGVRAVRADAGSGELPGFYALDCGSLTSAAALATELHDKAAAPQLGIDEVYVDTEPQWVLRGMPSDPNLAQQWHLINQYTNSLYDINAEPAWNVGITGTGVTVGIIEAGFNTAHPDIAANFNAAASQPAGNTTTHGTSVAGIIAADNNTIGGVGVAHDAQVSRLYYGHAQVTADAFLFRNDLNAIKTNSWGPNDSGVIWANSSLERTALASAVTNGRGGLGTVFLWAAGNGAANNDRVDYDPYASSRYTIAVGAIDASDHRSVYSEPGSALMLVAPSDASINNEEDLGIFTTTGTVEYTSSFGGTSASTPIAAGVVALMLDANPHLTWRDVQHVLIRTARKCDPTDAGWSLNGGGRWVNESYGFGAIDAGAAVALAQTWTNVSAEMSTSVTYTPPASILLPDAPPAPPFATITTSVSVTEPISVESVELSLTIAHERVGDLRVQLISPSGTVSTFAAPRTDPTDNYVDYVFTSVRCWGEDGAGTWTLRVSDERTGTTGSLVGWTLNIYGTPGQCACDFNHNNLVSVQDIFDFLTAWLSGSPSADFNGVNGVSVQDIFDFLTAWLLGC